MIACATTIIRSKEIVICDGIVYNDVYFQRQVLVRNYGRPYNLVVHKYSGILFFSHTLTNVTHVDFGITACHINKKVCADVAGVPGGYAIAYDAGNDDIYFGGHDGIYKYNFLTKSAEFFAEKGKSIWSIFIRRHFYYIEYPTQKLYVYQDDTFVLVAEALNIEVDHFFVSKNLDIYFSNKTALFKVEKMRKNPILLNDEIVVRQIVDDTYGDVYFCASNGVYLENKPYHNLKKMASIDNTFGMTFDENDHVIYSDKDAIYRLLPSKYSNVCYKALKNVEQGVIGEIDHSPKEELFVI